MSRDYDEIKDDEEGCVTDDDIHQIQEEERREEAREEERANEQNDRT